MEPPSGTATETASAGRAVAGPLAAGILPDGIVPPRATRRPASPRLHSALRAAAMAALAAAAVAASQLVTLPRLPLCAFKLLTGHPCPGCGMTRSVFRLAGGDVWSAFRLHPLGVAGGALAVALLAGGVAGAVTGRDPVWPWVARRSSALALWAAATLVGLWLVRAFLVPEWSPESVDASLLAAR